MGKQRAFQDTSQLLSLLPGNIGSYIRVSFYTKTLKSCSHDVKIGHGTFFPTRNIIIGNNVSIGAKCIIADSVIGKDVLIGSNVCIHGKNIHFYENVEVPIRLQGGKSDVIIVGDDVWIGNSSVIMDNIGNKSIIGSGSVILSKVEDYSIMLGNPARLVKRRI
jgi:acetyltransferase-like isoleucine patch superfamily enzyme